MAPLVALSCGEFDKFKGSNKVYSSQYFFFSSGKWQTLNHCIDKLLQLDCGL